MKRLIGLVLVLVLTAPVQAHFIFLLPSPPTYLSAQAIFSDTLTPDRPELLDKVARTEFFVRGPDGKAAPVKATKNGPAIDLELPGEGLRTVYAICPYGVVEKGKSGPFLLHYYSKTFVGLGPKSKAPADQLLRTWKRSALEIVPVTDPKEEPSVRVLWEDKPLADASVVLQVPGKDESIDRKTDENGRVSLVRPDRSGLYGVRVMHSEDKKGEQDGKKYASVRHIATFTFPVEVGSAKSAAAGASKAADPEATRLLADARTARANWDAFPGFSADLEVNVEGKVSKGKVKVGSRGKVTLDLEGESKEWARRTLESVVGHRLDNSTDLETPCAFADEVTDHPLGRAIRVLNDEYHSSYRIRDRQVIVVNRQAGPVRFTITVLENRLNVEKKFLPVSYVVNTWDAKTDALKSSAAHHDTWERVGKYDLPRMLMVVNTVDGKQQARHLKLANWQLLEAEK
jgi:uncharacterized GH25 family protein